MSGEGLLLVCFSLQFLRRMRTLPVICLASVLLLQCYKQYLAGLLLVCYSLPKRKR